ncbi:MULTISPECIES: hypothetical protein [unclassified Streptomyces]|uniref:hypothetical protein n=1 Tax=unclassified Streptomyces TaxID=2593676 RepID=UPI0010629EAF|nr:MULTISPECIES: hypothetical protein [unclassified Streptomyces]THA39056.1 hypothetical protein E6W17_12755 [Streptomyces sp. A1547]
MRCDRIPGVITDTDTEELLRAAVRNNAEWCAAVSGGGSFAAGAWTSARRTPPYYPDGVTLTREASGDALLAAMDTDSPGCSVKDSFADLDLAPAGFEVLFGAEWIHRPPAAPAPGACALTWSRVADAGELAAWEAAWGGGESSGLFHPGLLTEEIAFFAGRSAEGRIVAGAAANRTGADRTGADRTGADRTGTVVGLSNVFTADGTPDDEAWAGALTTVADLWPGLPVVGYESGEDLATAVRHGFAPLGPLRVWLHTA